MDDFGINEMFDMQSALQEKYKDKWNPICPDRGKEQLLWMIGEIGEVIDIIKSMVERMRVRMDICGSIL